MSSDRECLFWLDEMSAAGDLDNGNILCLGARRHGAATERICDRIDPVGTAEHLWPCDRADRIGKCLQCALSTMPIEDMTDTVSNNGAVHNGLIVSTFGTRTDLTRGLSISGWMSMGSRLNGITVCPLWNLHGRINGVAIGAVNHSASLHGVQIGIINKSLRTRGIQFGLWNRNEQRALPLVNWNFTHPPRPSYLDNTIRTSIWDTHHPPRRQRVSDRSGKPASDRRECGLEADSATGCF